MAATMKLRLRDRNGRELGILPVNLLDPSFEQPKDDSVLLRRYVDFPKLVDLLITKELNFLRMDLLADKFEGRRGRNYEKEVRRQIEENLAAGGALGAQGMTSEEFAKRWAARAVHYEFLSPQISFVSCWAMENDESEALWRIYGAGPAAASLVVSYGKLRDSIALDHHLYMGIINYFDFEAVADKSPRAMWPLMNKRRQFKYESEVRLIKMDESLRIVDPHYPAIHISRPDRPDSIRIGWDVADHVEKIVISPYAHPWQQNLIRETVARLCPGLEARVVDSIMR
jgi:hypothetical protein